MIQGSKLQFSLKGGINAPPPTADRVNLDTHLCFNKFISKYFQPSTYSIRSHIEFEEYLLQLQPEEREIGVIEMVTMVKIGVICFLLHTFSESTGQRILILE